MIRRHAIALIVAVALAGCASAGQNAPHSTVVIEVNNNLIPPGPAYIYLLSGSGMERDLGTVFGGARTLQYRGLELNGNYQFVAKTGSRTVASPILVMNGVTGLRWDLERNYMEVTRRQD